MNQKNPSELKVGFILFQLVGGFVLFVVLRFTMPYWDIILDILYWVWFLIVFLVDALLEIKLPLWNRKNTIVKIFVPFILGVILLGFVVPYVHEEIYELRYPHFKIADISYTHEYGQGYSCHAKIWNEGQDGTDYVYCFVTKGDLTTVSKSQQVYLHRNEETVIHFPFTEYEVGNDWTEYLVRIGS